MVEEILSGRQSDQRRPIKIGVQLELVEDADHGEPLLPQPDLLGSGHLADAQPLGGDGAQNRSRIRGRRLVEELPVGNAARQRVQQIHVDRLHRDAAGLTFRHVVRLVHIGIDGTDRAGLLNGANPRDHAGSFSRKLTTANADSGPRLHGEQVGAETIQLCQQVRLRRLGKPENADHRRNADHDAEGRQSRPQLAGTQADAGGAKRIRAVQP